MNPRDIHSLAEVVMEEREIAVEVDTLAHHVIDGIYTKIFIAKKAGTFLGQHAHEYDHGHLVVAGAMRVFLDGVEIGDFRQGEMVKVSAGKKHVFLALEDNTIGCCIHNVRSADEPELYERAVFA